MLLACVQTDIRFAAVRENLQTVLDTLEKLAEKNVDLAVFPECMLTGYAFESREEAWDVAINEDSEEIAEILSTSDRLGVSLTFGTMLRDGEKLRNAALLVAGGEIVGRYHKIHLPHLGGDRFVDRGEIPYQAFELPSRDRAEGGAASGGGVAPSPLRARVGLGICYDISFPEPMRALGLAGADIIALGTNWPVGAFRTAEIVPPARSMENHLFFVAANRIGHERGFDFCGISSICGPDGVELARAKGTEPEILLAEVDISQARNKRIERTTGKHVIDRFADRQVEFYDTLTDPVRPIPSPEQS
ncbi:MAG: carbon-nitrogen hydrolase family protein [Rhodopirellula sp. JB044]|uniref:carbon-nitrogen hydrolase family protein n=1 Tax=Rhodopirellula sp. JB044 TaxID=3342844 RepID=UPI00370B9B4C